ncbi:MCE family protein [Pseudonocardia spinosispora]|uniref:MCE family protein n=1 Tax=Pseudonocardia spinosispora TaxID=103441 RepID=UPI00042A104E|nr:MlaD family protein [Pseudonocardia spinosispora]
MIARTVKLQLIIFSILTLIAALLIVFVYARVPMLLGYQQMSVSVDLPKTGGLYPNANVTYRGYTIGKVKNIDLIPDGVRARMSIDSRHAPPANSRAEVHSVSAIGEQYLDFVPGDGPDQPMRDGAMIPMSRGSVPVPVADVLQNSQNLLTSLKQKDLTTVLDEGSNAFHDLGPDLGRVIDHTDSLVALADKNYDATHQLIDQAPRFLDSQTASSPAIRSWTKDLASFSDQLRDSDESFRDVLRNVPSAARNVGDFVDDLNSSAPTLLSSGNVLAKLAKAYHAPIEQVLVLYPMWVAADEMVVPPDQPGVLRFNLQTSTNRPGCHIGWVPPGQPGGIREANQLTDEPLPSDTYCKLPQGDPTLARSARYLQCFEPGSPPGRRAATIYQCRGKGYTTDQPRRVNVPGGSTAPIGGAPLSPPTGAKAKGKEDLSMMAVDDPMAAFGGTGEPAPKPQDMTWQSLMTNGIPK